VEKQLSKGPEAFRTISEVAEALDLPQHVLRFWETRFKQIKPMKRGGGRRYYRPQDVALLRGIRYLLYGEGYTIRGVQRILKEQGVQQVASAGTGAVEPRTAPEPSQIEAPVEAPAPVLRRRKTAPASTRVIEPVPAAAPVQDGADVSAEGPGLAREEVGQLQDTLAELVELKRLLDQAR
jgi:DNA-binding transcriptional MerR regulator